MYGSGAFTQTGGTTTVNDTLSLGYYASGSGAYNLSAGSLASNNLIVGQSGTGVFTQSGGTNTVSNILTLAQNSGSRGTYNLQGGSLTAATVNLNTGGLFNQTGGSLNAATFNQQGGTVTGALENRGVFNYTSGTFSGRLLNYGAANLYAGGNTSFTAGNGLLQKSATPLSIAAGQSLTLNGQGLTVEGSTMLLAGNLNATDEIIGDIGTGAVFTQTGGTNTASGSLTLANNLGSSGTYNLQGGSLSADTFNLNVGGIFNQSGGTFHFNTYQQ